MLVRAAMAARAGCDATSHMIGSAGRCNYIRPEQMDGVYDPGALAVAVAFETCVATTASLLL